VAEVLAGHESMCWWVARRVCPARRPDLLEDLAAEARAQFVRAAATFDPSRGLKFATYALRVAVHEARRAAAKELRRGVHLPQYLEGGVRVRAVLDVETGDGRENHADPPAPEPAGAPEMPADFWERIGAALDPREAEAVAARFREGLTLTAAGGRMGVSRERVRQLQARALEKLRLSCADLAQFLDQ
jgi:RNA polymerase sigma factor (sigma-70 family)